MADFLHGGIIINEILPDPNSAASGGGARYDTDGSGTVKPTDEFIELANVSDQPIDISGWELWDQALGKWFTFPAGTILPPGGHAMVMVGAAEGPGPLTMGGLTFYAGRGGAVLNNGPENVIVHDPVAGEYIQAAYGGASLATPGSPGNFNHFPSTSTRIGAGEDFGSFIPGYSIQRAPDGSTHFVNDQTPTPANQNLCLAAGTLIATPTGPCRIEDLRPGDPVTLAGGGMAPILWVGGQRQSPTTLATHPHLRPIRIAPGALAPGIPTRTLLVSRQHRLRVDGAIARRMGGAAAVLVPAAALLDLPGVSADWDGQAVSWHHILLPDHEVLLAEGTPVESLYLGAEVPKALSSAALAELRAIFPDEPWRTGGARPAHPLLPMRRARQLVARHHQHSRPLVAA